MDNRVLIYATNIDSLIRIGPNLRNEIKDSILNLDTSKKPLDQVYTIDINDDKIILMHDEILSTKHNIQWITEAKELIKSLVYNKNFHFIYHRKGIEISDFIESLEKNYISRTHKGMHEDTEQRQNYYYNLGDKLWDLVEKKVVLFDALWNDFDKNLNLERDLNHLHHIYQNAQVNQEGKEIDLIKIERDNLLEKYLQ
jgi:hypothetical protein